MSLHCIASMMSVSDHATEAAQKNCESWFLEIDNNPLEFLLTISKNPIMEPRLTVLRIYMGMASQPWAQKVCSVAEDFSFSKINW